MAHPSTIQVTCTAAEAAMVQKIINPHTRYWAEVTPLTSGGWMTQLTVRVSSDMERQYVSALLAGVRMTLKAFALVEATAATQAGETADCCDQGGHDLYGE